MSREVPRFVQISAAGQRIYALDEKGSIWFHDTTSGSMRWYELPTGEYAGYFSNKLNRQPFDTSAFEGE